MDEIFSSYFQECSEATASIKIIEERHNFILITVLSINVMRKGQVYWNLLRFFKVLKIC